MNTFSTAEIRFKVLAVSGRGLGTAVFQELVWLGEPEPAEADDGRGANAQTSLGAFADVFETSNHQRRHRRIELQNPEHQIRRQRLSQLQELQDAHPVLLRKTKSPATMIREGTLSLLALNSKFPSHWLSDI